MNSLQSGQTYEIGMTDKVSTRVIVHQITKNNSTI